MKLFGQAVGPGFDLCAGPRLHPRLDVGPRLVPAKEQDGGSPWVERVEHTIGSAPMLNPEFAHVAMT